MALNTQKRLSRLGARAHRKLVRGLIDHDFVYIGRFSGMRDILIQCARLASTELDRKCFVGQARSVHRMYMGQLADLRRDLVVHS